MPELITLTPNDYEVLALELSQSPNRLAGIKAKLLSNRKTLPLFDTNLFCRNLEGTFRRLSGVGAAKPHFYGTHGRSIG